MGIANLIIDCVKAVGPTIWKYIKYQIYHNDYVSEFKKMQEKLKDRLEDVEANLQTQLSQRGKNTKSQVDGWLKEVHQETAEKVVEDIICKGGCFTYICSSTNLEEKTEELKRILEEGKEFTNDGVSLVVDDHSIKYRVSVFKENQEKLKHQKEDIEANLMTQNKQLGKIARKEVEDWLVKAGQQIAMKVEDLISLEESSSSTNLGEKTEELKHILEEGKEFTGVNVSLVIDDHLIKGVAMPVEKCIGRDDAQKQILEWLKGDQVTRIAVWGMGGVGKTTIMKHVRNQLLKESKFRVIWVKVSKDFDIIVQKRKEFDILKFQKRIASSLELKLEPEDHENETKIAGLISQKLQQGSHVLILDDVWQQFRLEDVGIPDLDGNNGCKLVLTTRSQDVARAMDCKVIPVNPLPPDDALALFLEKVGSAVLLNGRIKRDIEPLLKQLLQKCDGAPLAIVLVAKTMREKLDPRSWKWALSKLSKFEGIVDRLKFSYECLEPQCRECFLFCALYPEDYEIPKEELIEYWIEEGFIDGKGETRDAMNCEGHVILEKLVDNCMLESVKNRMGEDCVTMHDLLREMAMEIRPRFLVKAGMGLEKLPEDREWREDLLKVSLMRNYIAEIPSSLLSLKCPMLTTLLLSNNKISTIPEAFFEHMLGLKILDLSNNLKLGSLPSSVSKLEKLTTLLLGGCRSLRKVPSLSNLKGLKKLELWGTLIRELPQGLDMLTNLKYLNLGEAFYNIPDGLLQNLSKLQHLDVHGLIPLKAEEIGKLGKLEFLYCWFSTVHDLRIFFNSREDSLNMYSLFVGDYTNILSDLKLKSLVCCDINICGESNWLPSDVQRLFIHCCKDVRRLNDVSGFQDATALQFVDIQDCDGMEFVLPLSWLSKCNLERLRLSCLDNLNAVFGEVGAVAEIEPSSAGTFSSLKQIHVSGCDKITKLFPVRWLAYLQNLQMIEVTWCKQMQEIISSEYKGGEKALEKVTLPKLESIEIENLPQLKSIYNGSSPVLICDSIKSIRIENCPKMESVFGSGFNPLPTLEYLTLQGLGNLKSVSYEEAPPLPHTTFFSLKTIRVFRCDQLKKVFSFEWPLSHFQFLQTIEVGYCKQMEELISSSAHKEEKVTLPIQRLQLMDLPALKSICNCSNVLICDSIQSLRISACQKLKRIPLNFPLLDNAQTSHSLSLKEIVVFPEKWWKSLEWDHPNVEDILLPFCKFEDDRFW
ncbi:hypothetical protein SLE2022_138510 [Rubroshorea leprosula]